MRACALREDVQDQPRSRQDAARQCVLEIALLAGTQRVIKDHQFGLVIVPGVQNFLNLPPAHKGVRMGCSARPRDDRNGLSTCRRHQFFKFVQTEVTALT